MPYYIYDSVEKVITGIEAVKPPDGSYGANFIQVYSKYAYGVGDDATKIVVTPDNKSDIKGQLALSKIANKTPAEVKAIVQADIDAVTTLAQAKVFLSTYIPLMAAGIVYLYQND